MNRRALLVAGREFVENLRTKTFWIGIMMFPVLIVGLMAVPALLERHKSVREYAVVDRSGWLLDEVERQIEVPDLEKYQRVRLDAGVAADDEAAVIAELNRRVAAEELFAYFVLPTDPVAGEPAKYVSRNLTDDDLQNWFAYLASRAVRERRLAAEEIDPDVARWVQEPLEFQARTVGESGAEEEVTQQDTIRQWAPIAFVYFLWFAVFTVAQMLLTNTIEEKSSRIMEVLLSSVSPIELMSGKILGIAATGLAMIGAWVGFFFIAVRYLPQMLGARLDFDLSIIAADPVYITSFVIYFLLGYLLYAAVLVGIGSVFNTLKEAQNLMTPVTLVLMVPLATMALISRDPNGTLAKVLSYVPLYTPFVMMNRAAAPPTLFEYIVTTLLLVASIAFALWGGAKIFRIGVLMTGKPPKLRELLRWLRAPIGVVPERRKEAIEPPASGL